MGAQTYTANVAGGHIAITRQISGNTVQNINISDASPSNSSGYPITHATIFPPAGYFPTQVVVTASENTQPITRIFSVHDVSFPISLVGVSQTDPSTSTIDFNVTYALIANAPTGVRIKDGSVGGQVEIINTDGTTLILNDEFPHRDSDGIIDKVIVTPPSTYALANVIIKGTNLSYSPSFNIATIADGYFPYQFNFTYPHDSTDEITLGLSFIGPIANPPTQPPQVSIGTPQVSVGTPQVSVGTPQVSVGSGGGNVSVGSSIGSSIGGGGGALQDLSNLRAETGLFGSLTEAELLEMRADVVKQIKAVMSGELVISVTIAGKQVTKKLPELSELRELLAETNNQLKLIDPQAYGKKRRRFGFDHRFRQI